MTGWTLATTCVSSTAERIDAMTDHPERTEVDYTTLVSIVGADALAQAFPDYDWDDTGGLTLQQDRCVRYHRSRYRGVPCCYVVHSAVEFVFVPAERMRSLG